MLAMSTACGMKRTTVTASDRGSSRLSGRSRNAIIDGDSRPADDLAELGGIGWLETARRPLRHLSGANDIHGDAADFALGGGTRRSGMGTTPSRGVRRSPCTTNDVSLLTGSSSRTRSNPLVTSTRRPWRRSPD
jgi:hypothetical protein